jgi:predicted small secreted protein
MKKRIISSIIAIGAIFSGCADVKTNYEDKELTKVFIKNNKNELNQFKYINTSWKYIPSFEYKDDKLNTEIYLSLKSIILNEPEFNRRINSCDYVMYIDSNTVEFLEDDIVHYGKEYMYKEAQKCLNTTLQLIDENQKAEIEQEVAENERNIKLNKKFNENEVK